MAKKLNQINKKLLLKYEAPFYVDCDKQGEMAFYRKREGCAETVTGETTTITSKASEQSVAKWLKKNTDTTFEEMFGRKPKK